ncbi:MAG TPA: glycosyltransferase 87 family protein [Propionibacteriaceae bacterium]|nr:glycosyltransferase 87 family protein [Propionibacteriaceae bacterium]
MAEAEQAPSLRAATVVVLVGVAALAFAARIHQTWRVGLTGLGNYDDGVDYASAVGLAHGLLPYRDFLFLHPPGITVLLLPFAALGRVVGDRDALAGARAAFVLLGALNAGLVVATLRRHGPVAAAVGGTAYALFPPAVYVEQTTMLEGPQATCLLLALLLLSRQRRTAWSSVPLLLAGAALGVACGIKIWGVVPAAVLIGWALVSLGLRADLRVAAGVTAGATAVCLPFFLAAPGSMWREVVVDQLQRGETPVLLRSRLTEILGASGFATGSDAGVLVLAAVLVGLAVVLACRDRTGRLAVVTLGATIVLLCLTPSWFRHYAALAGPALATALGAGTATALRSMRRTSARAVVAAVLLAGLAAYAGPTFRSHFGAAYPGVALHAALVDTRGCVTADDPATLILSDTLGRNLDRGCPLVIDLGGYSYDLRSATAAPVARAANGAWQRYALGYLGRGDLTVVTRFADHPGFARSTSRQVRDWPVVARIGTVRVRAPTATLPASRRSGG